MKPVTFISFALATLTLMLTGEVARAQYRDSRSPTARGEYFYRRPAVSPYLNLLRRDGQGGLGNLNYQTLVRPQLRAQEALRRQQLENRRLQQQTDSLDRRQQSLQLDPFSQPAGNQITGASRGIRPTGHTTSRMNTLHYFRGRR